jgi:hypothetical protein
MNREFLSERINSSDDDITAAQLESSLRKGRIEGMVSTTWEKVASLEINQHTLFGEVGRLNENTRAIESLMTEFAGIVQLDSLEIIIEEQRLRIDSILQGYFLE